MTFYSISGCSITISITFPEAKANIKSSTRTIDDEGTNDTDKPSKKKDKNDPFEKLLADA
jgi:hypothetical protein